MRDAADNRSSRWRWPLLSLLLLLLAQQAPAVAGSVEVITHPDHGSVSIDRSLLRAMFTMRVRQWPDGRPLRVFVFADDHPLHDRFSRELLGTYPYVLRTVWDRMVYTGTGLAPVVVASEDEMRRRVQATPGAIGYVGGAAPELRGDMREKAP